MRTDPSRRAAAVAIPFVLCLAAAGAAWAQSEKGRVEGGKDNQTIGKEWCGDRWTSYGTCGSSSGGGSNVPFTPRQNAIWSGVSLSGRRLAPAAATGTAQVGGVLAYDIFTVPESPQSLDLAARLGLAGGYSSKGGKLLDLVLGLGGGYTLGDLTLMALATLVWDGDWGAEAPALEVPSGLAVGPELHAQFWLTRWMALDLSAARVFRFTGDETVSAETRLSGALYFVGGGRGFGLSVGASFVDYGVGSSLAATLALKWGAR